MILRVIVFQTILAFQLSTFTIVLKLQILK